MNDLQKTTPPRGGGRERITLDKQRMFLIGWVLNSSPGWVEMVSNFLRSHSSNYIDNYNEYPGGSSLQDKLLRAQETLNTAIISDDLGDTQEQLFSLMDKAAAEENYGLAIEIRDEIITGTRIPNRIKARARKAVADLINAEEGIIPPPKIPRKKAGDGA